MRNFFSKLLDFMGYFIIVGIVLFLLLVIASIVKVAIGF